MKNCGIDSLLYPREKTYPWRENNTDNMDENLGIHGLKPREIYDYSTIRDKTSNMPPRNDSKTVFAYANFSTIFKEDRNFLD